MSCCCACVVDKMPSALYTSVGLYIVVGSQEGHSRCVE